MNRRWILALALPLAACATAPISSETATPAPAEQVLIPAFTHADDDKGAVILTRDRGALGAMCTMQIYVADAHVADLKQQQKVTLYVDAGEHIIGVRHARGICGAAGVAQELVQAAPGKVIKLRVGYLPDRVTMEHSVY